MLLGKKLIVGLLSLIIVMVMFSTAEGKSVYVINDTEASEMKAYRIDDTNLIWQTDYDFVSQTWGPVGITIDESAYGQFLFVTFEDENTIELVNAKTMKYVDTVTATGASSLAGIAVNQSKDKVYVIDRGENDLYVYSWDAKNRELTLDLPDPYYIELEDCYEGYGLAFDYENDRLYVADNTTTVKCYDSNDPNWSKLNDFCFTITDKAVGIAIDVDNQYVYTGGYWIVGSTYLTKYDFSTSSETRVNVGNPVLGICVDQETSLVYLTTYDSWWNPGTENRLMVYDSDPNQQWVSDDIGNPAGVAVGSTATYKPPLLVLTKDDNDVNCVLPGDYITYTITYDANGHSVSDVEIIDYLPYEVDFNSASGPNMAYDSNSPHTVTWGIGSLSPTDSNSVTLNVQVNELAAPNGIITNYCEMESSSTYNTAEVNTPVCCWCGDIIYVDVNAPTDYNTGASWQNAYKDLQDALENARNCECNEIWVAEGTYNPTKPAGVSATFQLVDGVAIYGGFDGNETSLSQRDWITNETTLSGDVGDMYYVVTASGVSETAIIDGFIIRKGYTSGVNFNGGSPTISHNIITENHHGVYSYTSCSPNITNCWIQNNSYDGIYFYVANSETVIRNNTIAKNAGYGIRTVDLNGETTNISNCIIWGNTSGQLLRCTPTYSCIENWTGGEGNINSDPCFVDPNNDDYHIRYHSRCIDAGDPNFTDSNETDIDGEPRLNSSYNPRVDIGADEAFPPCWSCLTQCHGDADCDGNVGTLDFYILRDSWDTNYCDDWNDGAGPYDPCADFNRDGYVGILDFYELRDNWDTSPPADCNCCGADPNCSWPPDCSEGRGGDGGSEKSESERAAEDELLLDELIDWLDELLADEELRKTMGEDDWKKFIEMVWEFIEELKGQT